MSLDPTLIVVIFAALVAGLVRGFSGFGAGMIFMPVAAATIGPVVAAAGFLILDNILALPLLVRALGRCDWRTVLPAILGAFLTVPVGAAILATADPVLLRWGLTAIVVALLVLLMSGWRYSGRPHPAVSFGAGGTAGILSGVAQIGGPPMVAFWIAGPYKPAVIRANIIVFFGGSGLAAAIAYLWTGIFTRESIELAVILTPVYALALFAGSRMFGLASERLYRRIAYSVIALAVVTSLPMLDDLLR